MPEGDTVYRTARRLTEVLGGRTLTHGEIRHPRLSTVDLAGRVVRSVRPVGKHLFVRFDSDVSLHNHLRMDGGWHVYAPDERWRRPGHQARVVLRTAERSVIGFHLHDLALVRTADERRLVEHLGPDLLAEDWDDRHAAEAAERLAADPDRQLGVALLDQRVMAGVGNVYKSEACFLLGVSPWTPVGEVDAAEAVRLCRDLLLRNATSVVRNTTGLTRRGEELWVYGRTRSGCPRCGGRVRTGNQGDALDRYADRITYYCPHCQQGPFPASAEQRQAGRSRPGGGPARRA